MIIHDLRCESCDATFFDQPVQAGCYGPCPFCGSGLSWIPSRVNTDVCGSIQSSPVLQEAGKPGVDMTWTSSRERDKKMWEAYGMRPVGDKKHGARTEYSPLGARSFHFGSTKNRSAERKKRNGRSTTAA